MRLSRSKWLVLETLASIGQAKPIPSGGLLAARVRLSRYIRWSLDEEKPLGAADAVATNTPHYE